MYWRYFDTNASGLAIQIKATDVMVKSYGDSPSTDRAGDAKRFYSKTLGMGQPYVDPVWRGRWSDRGTVFGVFAADPVVDGIPRSRQASGYISFSVQPAEKTLALFRKRGAQAKGRGGVFDDYRLWVASVVRDYSMFDRTHAPTDSKAIHFSMVDRNSKL